MHIGMIIPHLGPGGAERVASLLCNYWVRFEHSVSVITFDLPGVEPFFELDPRVERHQLNALNSETSNFLDRVLINARRWWRVRSVLKALRPDVVVAFMTEASVVTVLAARGLGLPVIVTERNQPDRPGLGRLRRLARRLTYPRATSMVVQTNEIAMWAKACFNLPVHVMPNPVETPASKGVSQNRQPGLIVAAGRLVYQKGFDILIESFARVAQLHPNWRLVIYGQGPEQNHLQARIERLSLCERISFAGLFTEIDVALGGADIFVLPSRFEGYPNVLLEALSLGCPVIATDCPGATAAILDHGRYGLLVPIENADKLAQALDYMMSNDELRAYYAAQAPRAVAHLSIDTIGKRWLELFSSLVKP